MRALVAVGVVVALLGGCVGHSSGDDVSPGSPGTETFAPGSQNKTVEVPPPSLNVPPSWQFGEWWKYRVKDGFMGSTYEATRIVAGVENDRYLVGMPHDSFSNDLMVLHLPGFGQVSRSNLSFDIHNVNFQPVQFPLKEGQTWKTAFEGRPMTAVVHDVSGLTARIQMDGGGSDHWNFTYDAQVGEVVKFVNPAYATGEVVDHGYNYTGIVMVPHMFKLVFQNGRFAGTLSLGLQPTTSISDTVKVDSTYDRVSFALIVGSLTYTSTQLSPGYYKETATGPDGKAFSAELTPAEGRAIKIVDIGYDRPGGTWKFDHVVAGPGLALSEGIAYHVYDVDLPSGRILPSMGEHHHGT